MRWKLAAVLGWSVVGLGLLMGASTRNEIRAKRLVIEDEKGRDRIVMAVEGDEASVNVYNVTNSSRCRVWADTDSAGMELSYYRGGFGEGKPGRKVILSTSSLVPPRLYIFDGERLNRKGGMGGMGGAMFPENIK